MQSTMSGLQLQTGTLTGSLNSCKATSQALPLARARAAACSRRTSAAAPRAFLRGYCGMPFVSRADQQLLEQMMRAASVAASPSAAREFELPLAVDASEEDDSYIFVADIPGVRREDLKVQTKDGKLSIAGKRERPSQPAEGTKQQNERVFGKFARQTKLPEDADCNNIKARVDNGVLTVTIGKLAKLPGVEDVQVDF